MLILNDQGGSSMCVSEDITHTLRANNGGHLPIIISYGFKPQQGVKAHGMGYEEEIAPSLTAAANQGVLISYDRNESVCDS